tara:strand:- start:5374 stop:6183 length:810 start_codon:yes stop_codon:yes gene_type:complete
MVALAALVGGMATGRLDELAAEDKRKIDENKIATAARIKRQAIADARMTSVSQVMEEISIQNPDTKPGDLRKLGRSLVTMPEPAFKTITNLVYSPESTDGYKILSGKIRKNPTVKPITEPSKQALEFAEMALTGMYPQFDEELKRKGVDRDAFVSAADDSQRSILKLNVANVIQRGMTKGIEPSQSILMAAPTLAKSGKLDVGTFWNSLDLTTTSRPESVQVNPGGTTQDWSSNPLYEWGGRMWRWLGGPEGPRHNPAGHDPSKWELAS